MAQNLTEAYCYAVVKINWLRGLKYSEWYIRSERFYDLRDLANVDSFQCYLHEIFVDHRAPNV